MPVIDNREYLIRHTDYDLRTKTVTRTGPAKRDRNDDDKAEQRLVHLIDAQFFCPMVETRSTISESILRKSFRRPLSGFNLRLRTTIVRSRIWCSISRETCSIGPYDLSAARQISRSFSRRAMYALAIVRRSRRSA